MGPILVEVACPLLLALFGVIAGWWLRRWARVSGTTKLREGDRVESAEEALAATFPLACEPYVDRETGLSHRDVFIDDLGRRVAEWKRVERPLSVVLIRIDDFEVVTQRRGLRAGQTLLVAMSQFLRAMMRDMDHVARYQSDTFAALLPGANLENAMRISQRIALAVARCRLPLEGAPLAFSVTTGVAEVKGGDGVDALLARAEAALTRTANRRARTGSAPLGKPGTMHLEQTGAAE